MPLLPEKATIDEPRLSGMDGAFFRDVFSLEAEMAEQHESCSLRETEKGLSWRVEIPLAVLSGPAMEAAARQGYELLFALMARHKHFKLVRTWNFIPEISKRVDGPEDVNTLYRCFNLGRYEAYRNRFGRANWPVVAATAVGHRQPVLILEALAVRTETKTVFLENREQTPAPQYSDKHGRVPPLFVRGVYLRDGQREILLASGTGAIKGEDSLPLTNPQDQLRASWENVTVLAGRGNLRHHGLDTKFEDRELSLVQVFYKRRADRDAVVALCEELFDERVDVVQFRQADICRAELLVEVEAVFSRML